VFTLLHSLNARPAHPPFCSKQCLPPVLSAMGAIAIVIDDDFAPYYDSCAAIFTGLVASTAAPTAVRNKALESFSMICEAVGKEKSGMDAAQVLNELVRALVSPCLGEPDAAHARTPLLLCPYLPPAAPAV
jgi:hypothetical protein